jgi:hypothetical protein
MRAQKFTRRGVVQIAIVVTGITGRGFGLVVLEWGSSNAPALGRQEQQNKSVCVGLKTMVGREEPEGQDSLGEIGVVVKFKRLAY